MWGKIILRQAGKHKNLPRIHEKSVYFTSDGDVNEYFDVFFAVASLLKRSFRP